MTLSEQIKRNKEILNRPNYTNRMSTRQTPTSTATVSRPSVQRLTGVSPVKYTSGIGSVTPTSTKTSLSEPIFKRSPYSIAEESVRKTPLVSNILKGTGTVLEKTGGAISATGRPFTSGRTFFEQVGAVGRGEVSPILGGPAGAIKGVTGLIGGTIESYGRTLKSYEEKGPKAFDVSKVIETGKKEGILEALSTPEAENLFNLADIIPGGGITRDVTLNTLAFGILNNLDKTDESIDIAKNLGKFENVTKTTSQIIRKGGIVDNNIKFFTNVDNNGNILVTTRFTEFDAREALRLPGQKQRGIVDDVRESLWIPEKTRQTYNAFYTPQAGEPMFQQAVDQVSTDLEKTLRDFKNADISPDQTTPIGYALANKLFEQGRTNDALDVIDILGKRSTQFGQSNSYIQFFSRMTPEGMVKYGSSYLNKEAEKIVPGISKTTDNIANTLTETNKKVIDQVVGELDNTNIDTLRKTVFKDSISEIGSLVSKQERTPKVKTDSLYKQAPLLPDVENYIVDELRGIVNFQDKQKELPSKILSEKILSYLKPKEGDAAINPVAEMVNTLYKVAKESLPPAQKAEASMKNAIETIANAVKYRKNYIKVWEEAQQIIEKKFVNNPKALAKIKEFNEKVLFPTYSLKDSDRLIKNLLAKDGNKITEIIKRHYSEVDKIGETLAEKLVSQTNLSGDDAQILEIFTVKRFKELAQETKSKELDRIFKVREGIKEKNRKELIQSLVEWSNLGAFNRSDLFDRIAGKLKIPHLPASLANDIYNRMLTLQEINSMYLPSINQERLKELTRNAIIKNIYEDIQRQNPLTWGEKLSYYQRANLLSRVSTLTGNLYTGFKATFIDIPASKALSGQLRGLPEYFKKIFESIPSAIEDFNIAYNGGFLSNPDLKDVRLNIARDNPVLDILSNSFRLMEGIDKFFTRLIVEGTDNPELADYFLKRARPDSKNLKQGAVLRGLDRLTEGLYSLRRKLGTPGHILVPFLQYGTNVFKQKLEFSPLGFTPWFQTKDGLENGKAMLGTIHMMWAFNKAVNGDIVLEAPRNEREKQKFYGEGKIPYSIRYTLPNGKDYYIPMAYGEQFEPMYVFAGQFMKRWNELEGLSAENVMSLSERFLSSFTEAGKKTSAQLGTTTGLATFNRSAGLLSGDPNLVSQGITSITSGFVPVSGLQDSINSMIDDTIRQRNTLKGQLIGSTPGLSKQLEPYTGLYGEESKKRIGQSIFPYGISKAKDEYAYTKEEQEILKKAESSEQTQKLLIERAKKETEKTGRPQRVGEIEIKMYQGKPTEFKIPQANLKFKTQAEIIETTQRAEEESSKLSREGNINENLSFYLDKKPNNDESSRVVANLYKKNPEVLNYLLDRGLLTDDMVNRIVLENAKTGQTIERIATRLDYIRSTNSEEKIDSQGADLLLDAYNEKIITAQQFNQIVTTIDKQLSDTAKKRLIGDVSVDTLIKQNATQDQRGQWLVNFLKEVQTKKKEISSSTMDYIIKLNTNGFINKDTIVKYVGSQKKTESALTKYNEFIRRIE